jgi:hypothetical protein
MAKKKHSKVKAKARGGIRKLKDWCNEYAGIATVVSAVAMLSFFVGTRIEALEINEINQTHNIELAKQKSQFDEKVIELNRRIDELIHEKHMIEYELKQIKDEKGKK